MAAAVQQFFESDYDAINAIHDVEEVGLEIQIHHQYTVFTECIFW